MNAAQGSLSSNKANKIKWFSYKMSWYALNLFGVWSRRNGANCNNSSVAYFSFFNVNVPEIIVDILTFLMLILN